MMSIRIIFLFLAIVAGSFACNTTEPPPPPPPGPPQPGPTINLSLEDTGVTEAWLKLSIPDTVTGRAFTLIRDSQLILSSPLIASDTVLVNEGLIPNHLYTYRAYRVSDSTVVDSTEALSVTTMDTTSHAFVFEIDTLGGASSSVLLDAAIVDENNIWAVGEMYVTDSTGQIDPLPYNVARWDGAHWSLVRMMVPIFCGPDTYPSQAQALFSFSATDIWIASGITIMRWNGLTFTPLCIPTTIADGTINKMWGASETSVYCVGNNGTIVHYDGTTWQKLESGTELDVNDVFGAMNPSSAQYEVYAVAAKEFVTLDRKIFHIVGTTVEAVSDSGIPGSLQGIWFKPQRKYYVAGNGMFSKNSIDSPGSWLDAEATQYYLYGLSGFDLNDVVATGTYGEVVHFNGSSWVSYRAVTGLSLGIYYRVAMKNNLVVAVGFDGGLGIVARGNR